MIYHGFTLIELLLVIAIIAILAAIAIPNFMAAQIRAKVSGVKSELKMIVTAVEAYHIDNTAYPPYHYNQTGFYLGGWVTVWPMAEPFNGANPVTTPITYITKMPKDPFYTPSDGDPFESRNYGYVNWDQAQALIADDDFAAARQKYGSYRIHSIGPDRLGPDFGLAYDPTNGITSHGDIFYTAKNGFDSYGQVTTQ
ncbi:MAG: prepilin-type N-terminal cleavage/methylation domain-containing protein [bacterium]